MTFKYKLSIVIPVFKVEKYIRKCLSSLLQQDADETSFEIIIVNDGTPDNSMAICEEFASCYNNITIVTQVNQGLSAARNAGLSLCQGEYVWFFDSDDEAYDFSVSTLLYEISKSHPDCFLLGHKEVNEDNTIINEFQYSSHGKICGNDFLHKFFKDSQFFIPAQFSVWKIKFLKENDLRFTTGIFHEDCDFTIRALVLANSIMPIMGFQYKYIRHANTISTTKNAKRSYDLIIVSKNIAFQAAKHPEIDVLNNYVGLFVFLSIYNLIGCKFRNVAEYRLKLKEQRIVLKCMSSSRILKYRIASVLLRLFTLI